MILGIEENDGGNGDGDKKEEMSEEMVASLFDEEGDEKKDAEGFIPISEEFKKELSKRVGECCSSKSYEG